MSGAYGHARPELVVSGYWGGPTLSRVLVSLLGDRLRPERLVLASALAVTLASALTHWGAGAVPLLTLTSAGLCALLAVTLRGTSSTAHR